jgi:hypothetical protein
VSLRVGVKSNGWTSYSVVLRVSTAKPSQPFESTPAQRKIKGGGKLEA